MVDAHFAHPNKAEIKVRRLDSQASSWNLKCVHLVCSLRALLYIQHIAKNSQPWSNSGSMIIPRSSRSARLLSKLVGHVLPNLVNQMIGITLWLSGKTRCEDDESRGAEKDHKMWLSSRDVIYERCILPAATLFACRGLLTRKPHQRRLAFGIQEMFPAT